MKLVDGLTLRGQPAEIPDCSRDDLPAFFVELGYNVGAEIGVYKGEFTKKFLDVGLEMYGIDPWQDYFGYRNNRGQERINFQYEHAQRVLAPYSNYTIIREPSIQAVNRFTDESLDFVYIDGNHLLKYVVEDICEWSKKVRKGGIISGHDYFYQVREHSNIIHVPYAVEAFTKAYGVEDWYVLGREERVAGERRDRWRSWMWIKNYDEPSPLVEA